MGGADMVVGIVGGGAAGMAAALAAAENPGVQVVLLERQSRLGRKLGATGNGRCNLTNLHALQGGYHGSDPSFAVPALTAFDVDATLKWFRQLGLFTVAEPSGRVYPYSDQANSVVDVLRFALEKPNIQVLCGFEVAKARKVGSRFSLEDGQQQILCDKLIIACGGLAGSKLGGSMSGYKLLGKFGHRSTRLRPALVQVKTDWSGISALKGVRANCTARIFRDGQETAAGEGELQFTETGLSGPLMFELSRDVCQDGARWSCRMDFLPHISAPELETELLRRRETQLSTDELLTGILHNRLGRVLTKAAGIKGAQPIAQLREEELAYVCRTVKGFEVPLLEPLGMDSAQVTAGGVITDGFDPKTMESKTTPGLYACGEVLDIDGDCGGYNLQWAWSSGRMAGIHAGKDSK
jgi:predicted Rossmann fold flavoprotein